MDILSLLNESTFLTIILICSVLHSSLFMHKNCLASRFGTTMRFRRLVRELRRSKKAQTRNTGWDQKTNINTKLICIVMIKTQPFWSAFHTGTIVFAGLNWVTSWITIINQKRFNWTFSRNDKRSSCLSWTLSKADWMLGLLRCVHQGEYFRLVM